MELSHPIFHEHAVNKLVLRLQNLKVFVEVRNLSKVNDVPEVVNVIEQVPSSILILDGVSNVYQLLAVSKLVVFELGNVRAWLRIEVVLYSLLVPANHQLFDFFPVISKQPMSSNKSIFFIIIPLWCSSWWEVQIVIPSLMNLFNNQIFVSSQGLEVVHYELPFISSVLMDKADYFNVCFWSPESVIQTKLIISHLILFITRRTCFSFVWT